LAYDGLLGYAPNNALGGMAIQSTSKSTSVYLNKVSGNITTNNAALAAGATVKFWLGNTYAKLTSLVHITPTNFGINYRIEVETVNNGNIYFRITNITAVTLSDAIQFNFIVLEGAWT
jgi:hypothetical protein